MMENSEILRKLHFKQKGILGFEKHLEYVLTAYDPETPFYWLRSLDDPELAFLVLEPHYLLEDYSFDLSDEEANLLEISSAKQAFVLVLLTVPENPLEMTANLLGPLVFHKETHLGRQVVLEKESYSLRFPVFGTLMEGVDLNVGTQP